MTSSVNWWLANHGVIGGWPSIGYAMVGQPQVGQPATMSWLANYKLANYWLAHLVGILHLHIWLKVLRDIY